MTSEPGRTPVMGPPAYVHTQHMSPFNIRAKATYILWRKYFNPNQATQINVRHKDIWSYIVCVCFVPLFLTCSTLLHFIFILLLSLTGYFYGLTTLLGLRRLKYGNISANPACSNVR